MRVRVESLDNRSAFSVQRVSCQLDFNHAGKLPPAGFQPFREYRGRWRALRDDRSRKPQHDVAVLNLFFRFANVSEQFDR